MPAPVHVYLHAMTCQSCTHDAHAKYVQVLGAQGLCRESLPGREDSTGGAAKARDGPSRPGLV